MSASSRSPVPAEQADGVLTCAQREMLPSPSITLSLSPEFLRVPVAPLTPQTPAQSRLGLVCPLPGWIRA